MAKAVKKKGRVSARSSEVRALAAELNEALGSETAIRLASDPYFTIERIPTGSLVMDRITGGGFARGRHYELYGDESTGKSYIVYRTMVLAQERGEICAIIDPEHSFDNERFAFLGGNNDELLASHPETAEQAVSAMMLLARSENARKIGVVGIDSVASLLTKEEIAKNPEEDDRVASQARMMSRALRRITAVNNKTTFLWTNQERVNIMVKFGNPNTTPGGRALRFYATGRIEFRRGGKVNGKTRVVRGGKLVEAETAIGRWTQVRVEKDKSTIPNREGAFLFNYNAKRIDEAYEILSLGMVDKLIERSATGRYAYVDLDDREWKGTEKQFVKFLRRHEELRAELVSAIVAETHRGWEDEEGGDEDSEE